jgi:hypothetical protein
MMLNTRGYLNIAENTETDVSDKRLFRDQKWIQVASGVCAGALDGSLF